MFSFFKSGKKTKSMPAVTLLPGSQGEHFLQRQFDTRQRALKFYDKQVLNFLSPVMMAFLPKQESLFIATADRHGECDCSARFGQAGFIRVLDNKHLTYPEYRGNGVMASLGNITENPHIGMIFIDFYETTVGLHVNGEAKIFENEELIKHHKNLPNDVIAEIQREGNRRPERWVMVEVEEAYIQCSKHIPLLRKQEKTIHWGTDNDIIKRSDFFDLSDLSLYERIGGDAAIEMVLDRFYRKILLDDGIKHFFDDIPIGEQLKKQQNFLKMAFGGFGPDNPYSDDYLRSGYRRLFAKGLNDKDFDRVVKHLQDTLQELDVPAQEIARIMETLKPTRDTIPNR
ncbi:globin domain-containing protein [Methylomonas sp. MgM2]